MPSRVETIPEGMPSAETAAAKQDLAHQVLRRPDVFLRPQPETAALLLNRLSALYTCHTRVKRRYAKLLREQTALGLAPEHVLVTPGQASTHPKKRQAATDAALRSAALEPVYTEGFDAEAVWAQLDRHLAPLTTRCARDIHGSLESINAAIKRSRQPEAAAPAKASAPASSAGADGEASESSQDSEHSDDSDDNDAASSHANDADDTTDDDDSDASDAESADPAAMDHDDAESALQEDDALPLDSDADAESDAESDADGEAARAPARKKWRRTIVDDPFFSLREMEAFAEENERRDQRHATMTEEEIAAELAAGGEDWVHASDLEDQLDDDVVDAPMPNGKAVDEIMFEDFFGPRSEVEDIDGPPPAMPEDEDDEDAQSDEHDVSASDAEGDADHNDEAHGLNLDAMDEQDADEANPDFQPGQPSEVPDVDEEDEEVDLASMTPFERQQYMMRQQIAELEKEAVAKRSWHLMGEATAKQRPKDALLQQDLDVDRANKPVPVVTEETTKTLEDLIIQRIKDKLFDDVIRKLPPAEASFDPNKRVVIDETKSSKSLAQLYEDDFARAKTKAAEGVAKRTLKDEALAATHEQIDKLFAQLSTKLDALTQYAFTPKPLQLELAVAPAPNVPALALEEILPGAVATATLTAPQEVAHDLRDAKDAATGEALVQDGPTREEMSKEERVRARRQAKRQFQNKQAAIEAQRNTRRAQYAGTAAAEQEKETDEAGGATGVKFSQANKRKEKDEKLAALEKLQKAGNVTILDKDSTTLVQKKSATTSARFRL